MSEYNELTKKLLAEGYTVDNHPDYVSVGSGAFKENKLDNFDGGFVYYFWYLAEKTYTTPCGLHCKGAFTHDGMSWLGEKYCYENNNPLIICPKDCANCQLRDEPFRSQGTGVLAYHCPVHMTDKEWTYEGSCEKERHLYDEQIRRDKISFILEKNNRVCEQHMRYNKETHKWEFHYNPTSCANGFCRAQNTDFKDDGYCPVLNKQITREKGNVFYDIRYWGRDYSKDGTIFEGEQFKHIIKGRQLFNKPIRLDIARVIANTCKDHIRFIARYNNKDYDSLTMFRAERGEIDFHWEVLNIRAEKKYTRDLEQDLKDIELGISVTHEIDETKRKKQEKSERRKTAKEKRISKLEKMVLEKGFENLEIKEQRQVEKNIDSTRIYELEVQRIKNLQKHDPKQMSLEDFIG